MSNDQKPAAVNAGQKITLTWETTVRYTATVPAAELAELLKDDDSDDYLDPDGGLNTASLEGGTAGGLDDYLASLEYTIDQPGCPARPLETTSRNVEAATLASGR